MKLTSKQKEVVLTAHLLDKPIKDAELIKLKLADKKGVITSKGESVARAWAAEKNAEHWS